MNMSITRAPPRKQTEGKKQRTTGVLPQGGTKL